MSYMSDLQRVEDTVRTLPELPPFTPPANDQKLKFTGRIYDKLKEVVSSIDNGRLAQLLKENIKTQQQHSSLLAQYWRWVYYEFITQVAPLGFSCTYTQMRNKWRNASVPDAEHRKQVTSDNTSQTPALERKEDRKKRAPMLLVLDIENMPPEERGWLRQNRRETVAASASVLANEAARMLETQYLMEDALLALIKTTAKARKKDVAPTAASAAKSKCEFCGGGGQVAANQLRAAIPLCRTVVDQLTAAAAAASRDAGHWMSNAGDNSNSYLDPDSAPVMGINGVKLEAADEEAEDSQEWLLDPLVVTRRDAKEDNNEEDDFDSDDNDDEDDDDDYDDDEDDDDNDGDDDDNEYEDDDDVDDDELAMETEENKRNVGMNIKLEQENGEGATQQSRFYYTCSDCDRTFSSVLSLNKHQRRHLGDKRHSCSLCAQSFVRLWKLRAHMSEHNVEETFGCSLCPRVYKSSEGLMNHMAKHGRPEKPHACAQCNKAFSKPSVLLMHMQQHGGERPFSCSQCSKSFVAERLLKKHQIFHSAERPHCCSACGKSFKTRRTLNVHRKTHSEERPFPCLDCGKMFTTRKYVRSHQKKVHMG